MNPWRCSELGQSSLEKLQDRGRGEKWALMEFSQQCCGGVSAAEQQGSSRRSPEVGEKGFAEHSWQHSPEGHSQECSQLLALLALGLALLSQPSSPVLSGLSHIPSLLLLPVLSPPSSSSPNSSPYPKNRGEIYPKAWMDIHPQNDPPVPNWDHPSTVPAHKVPKNPDWCPQLCSCSCSLGSQRHQKSGLRH